MTTMTPVSETFTITEEILVRATLEKTFASLIAQMGRLNETPDGKPLPMLLEPHPGGRWFRDLGGDNGHLWGFVQSIKRPVLLEIWGPLFMSTAATSNLLYRLTEVDGGSLITFTHTLVGRFPEDHRPQLSTGWAAAASEVHVARPARAACRDGAGQRRRARVDGYDSRAAGVRATGSGDGRRARPGAHRERSKGQTASGWLR